MQQNKLQNYWPCFVVKFYNCWWYCMRLRFYLKREPFNSSFWRKSICIYINTTNHPNAITKYLSCSIRITINLQVNLSFTPDDMYIYMLLRCGLTFYINSPWIQWKHLCNTANQAIIHNISLSILVLFAKTQTLICTLSK